MPGSVTMSGPAARRFGWIMSGHRLGPDRAFDEDLDIMGPAAVIPTKGALVPEWLLVVPRIETMSLADLPSRERRAVLACARKVEKRIVGIADDAVLFEHGPRRAGIASGCGVDQAHLHVVGLKKGFAPFVLSTTNDLNWTPADVADPWESLPLDSDYLVMLRGGSAWRAITPAPVSQFMRRRIAHFVGTPGEWDYRRYPHAANAERTKALFRFGGDA